MQWYPAQTCETTADVADRERQVSTATRQTAAEQMNTRLLMILSAAFMAAVGVGITFLPQELLAHVGARPEGHLVLLIRSSGAS